MANDPPNAARQRGSDPAEQASAAFRMSRVSRCGYPVVVKPAQRPFAWPDVPGWGTDTAYWRPRTAVRQFDDAHMLAAQLLWSGAMSYGIGTILFDAPE